MSRLDAELIIIGGGFWGSAAAALANTDCLLLDDEWKYGASRNAAGIICKSWYVQDTVRKMRPHWLTDRELERSLEWLTARCGLQQTGELFYHGTDFVGPGKEREDCWLLESPNKVFDLVGHRMCFQATRLERVGGVWVVHDASTYMRANKVLVCAGSHTSHLLNASGLPSPPVKGLLGRAVLLKGNVLEKPVTTLTRPYTHFTARPWQGGLVRLGDTVERTGKTSAHDRKSLSAVTEWLQAKQVALLAGYRPLLNQFFAERVADDLVVATGGHRVGLGVAPAAARRALQLLDVPIKE